MSDSGRIRILVADDQLRARMGLKALLATWPHAGVVLEAQDGSEAVSMIELWRPDLVVLDARMPEMDGVDAARAIKGRWPHVKVVVLSLYAEYREAALAAGADAFFCKGQPPEQFLAALAALTGRGVQLS